MTLPPEPAFARRTIIQGAGLGVGAELLASLPAQAQTTGAAPDQAIWSAEYWARKGDVPLYLWRKRAGAPAAGAAPLPVLFLVHGSSVTPRAHPTI